MKQYLLKITDKALLDMAAIYDYIADQLQAPETAMQQYNRIADAIETLSAFPERCSLLHSQPEQSLGMRQLPVDHYVAVFVVDEAAVIVLRVLYSASDINHRLRMEI